MSAISELPSVKPDAEFDSLAAEDPCMGSAVAAEDEDDVAEAPMARESAEACTDGIFPGYPLS